MSTLLSYRPHGTFNDAQVVAVVVGRIETVHHWPIASSSTNGQWLKRFGESEEGVRVLVYRCPLECMWGPEHRLALPHGVTQRIDVRHGKKLIVVNTVEGEGDDGLERPAA